MTTKNKLLQPRIGNILLNQNILRNRFHIKRRHLFLPLLLIIVFLLNRRYFVFGFLTIFSGIFSFYHDKINKSPLDLKMPLFLGLIITRYYGLGFTAIFFVLSDVIPSLLGGGRIEGNTLFFFALYFSVNALVLLFPFVNMIILGIVLVIIHEFGSVLIKNLFGYPILVAVGTSVLSIVTRVLFFITLGEVLVVFLELL